MTFFKDRLNRTTAGQAVARKRYATLARQLADFGDLSKSESDEFSALCTTLGFDDARAEGDILRIQRIDELKTLAATVPRSRTALGVCQTKLAAHETRMRSEVEKLKRASAELWQAKQSAVTDLVAAESAVDELRTMQELAMA